MSKPLPRIFSGQVVAPGQVAARICLYSHKTYEKVARRLRSQNIVVPQEIKRFRGALDSCETDLMELREKVRHKIGEAEASVFDAQSKILRDPTLTNEIESLISSKIIPFETAVEEVYSRFEKMFQELDDEYLKSRSSDITEVKERLLHSSFKTEPGFVCTGNNHCGRGVNSIIVTENLTAEMIAEINFERVLGIVTESGGIHGHAAILARSTGIPVMIGVKGVTSFATCGSTIYINSTEKQVMINPPDEIVARYSKRNVPALVLSSEVSLPGVKIYANCSSLSSVLKAMEHGADGVGLFRTEMLFLQEGKLLTEEEQFTHYSAICKRLEGKPISFRLLDIGGDKKFPFIDMIDEDNPFLGWRGLRFLLDNKELLQAQLHALMRVALDFPLSLLIPMVIDEVQLEEVLTEITKAMTLFDVPATHIVVGAMFETPSSILLAEEILSRVDFGSIGSNDLIQYLFTVDRNNEKVAEHYQSNHPLLWKIFSQLAQKAQKLGKNLSLCGELATEPGMASRLYSLGISQVSVAIPYIADVRHEMNLATTI